MESTRMVTRSQRQRMGVAVDENAAVHGRKDAGNQLRPRRALNNISNRQPTETAAPGKNNNATGALKVKSSSVNDRTGELEAIRNDSETEKRTAEAEEENTEPSKEDEQNNENKEKPTSGFTRTLIAKTERPSTHSLVKRTENLQLDGDEEVICMSSPVPDIDGKDLGDHLQCAEYAAEIFTFFKRMEPRMQIDADYMSRQRYITRQMRAVLIDWLVDVHAKFKLIPESLFLAIWILDRFLSKQEVERKNLQLAGIAALVIANKYEEVYGPVLRDYETICAGAYTRADILKMERAILKTLDFGLTVPTAFTFLGRYIKASNYGQYAEFRNLSQYLCEWSLLSYTCLRWSGSMIAAAAVYASFKAFSIQESDNDWPRILRKHTGYTVEEISPCATYLVNLMDKATNTQYRALFHKFKKKEYCGVARYKAPTAAFGLNSQNDKTAGS